MPQWAGSCWYHLRYLDPANDGSLADPAIERYWMSPSGVDLYVGGVEHAVLHLLYARFWHMVLYDCGATSSPEPFGRLFNQGYILADAFTDARGLHVPAAEVTRTSGGWERAGQPVTRRAGKMGKSLKNGVSPDDIYASYGADTLRLYEMAMGPLDGDRPWRADDITGMHRFLQRLWRLIIDETTGETRVPPVVRLRPPRLHPRPPRHHPRPLRLHPRRPGFTPAGPGFTPARLFCTSRITGPVDLATAAPDHRRRPGGLRRAALPHRDRADHRADRARLPAAAACRVPWPSRWS